MYLLGDFSPRFFSIICQVSRCNVIDRAILFRAFFTPGFLPAPMRLPPRCFVWFILVKLCALQPRPCWELNHVIPRSVNHEYWLRSNYCLIAVFKCCQCYGLSDSLKNCGVWRGWFDNFHSVVIGWRRKSSPMDEKTQEFFSSIFIFLYSTRKNRLWKMTINSPSMTKVSTKLR